MLTKGLGNLIEDELKNNYSHLSFKVHIFWEGQKISSVDLAVTTLDKSTMEISQNFVAFSEYMNFNWDEKICKSFFKLQWGCSIKDETKNEIWKIEL